VPFPCIEGIQLKIDGEVVVPADITFILNHYSHRLDETGRRYDSHLLLPLIPQ